MFDKHFKVLKRIDLQYYAIIYICIDHINILKLFTV